MHKSNFGSEFTYMAPVLQCHIIYGKQKILSRLYNPYTFICLNAKVFTWNGTMCLFVFLKCIYIYIFCTRTIFLSVFYWTYKNGFVGFEYHAKIRFNVLIKNDIYVASVSIKITLKFQLEKTFKIIFNLFKALMLMIFCKEM